MLLIANQGVEYSKCDMVLDLRSQCININYNFRIYILLDMVIVF